MQTDRQHQLEAALKLEMIGVPWPGSRRCWTIWISYFWIMLPSGFLAHGI